jgi:Lamin Tail Domain/Bacterial Ig-like domain
MKYTTLLALLLALCHNAMAQIADDFSDGDLTTNPAWTGEVQKFMVNAARELQLNAPTTETTAYIVIPVTVPNGAVWQTDVRLPFDPSTTNLFRFYLQADRVNLPQANGYYIEIGETGTQDVVRLYRQDGTARTLLATGSSTVLVNGMVNIKLRINRTTSGDWIVAVAQGAGAFQTQLQAKDQTYSGGAGLFSGYYCAYTSTRSTNFFMDNVSLQTDGSDNQAPVLRSVTALDATTLLATFDEALQATSANETTRYRLATGPAITSAALQPSATAVRLSLANPLTPGQRYTLTVQGVADVLGNVDTMSRRAAFRYIQLSSPAEFDILIHEIMADPDPSVGLPPVEWVELYNRSNKYVQLSALRWSDSGGTPVALPDYVLEPDSFVVLTTTAGFSALAPVATNRIAMAGFPSLNNDADALSLRTADGVLIDAVTYAVSWHATTAKRDGGWSLERINPNTPCIERSNWTSCLRLPGGTPGRVNSVLNREPDTKAPRLLSALPVSATRIQVTFSEGMDRNKAADATGYVIEPSLRLRNVAVATDRSIVTLDLAEPLRSGVVYQLTLRNTIQDCSGNSVPPTDTTFFGLPEVPTPGDVIINEVLFNPPTGGVRYVEIYNRSNKIFDWKTFALLNEKSASEPINTTQLCLPGQYITFTPDPTDIATRHYGIKIQWLLTQTLPPLNDKAGSVVLLWAKDGRTVTVDSFGYRETMHNALFNSTQRNGIALERIRINSPTNEAANWTSASPARTGSSGSPTLPNSQTGTPLEIADWLQLPVARLSPDGDGFEDFLDIQYQTPAPGFAMQAAIYDSGGIFVRQIERIQLTGITGALRWDGDTADGSLARPGIYMLFAELFAPDGQVQRVKKPFGVVVRK